MMSGMVIVASLASKSELHCASAVVAYRGALLYPAPASGRPTWEAGGAKYARLQAYMIAARGHLNRS